MYSGAKGPSTSAEAEPSKLTDKGLIPSVGVVVNAAKGGVLMAIKLSGVAQA
jgi:hypothetical protein